MPTIEDQRNEARQWAQWFRDAGYEISFQHTGGAEPFDREWQVWTAGGSGQRVATIDIDGCGASWHGPDGLWIEVVGPHTTSTKEIGMDTTTRTQLDVDEQVRIAALTIASARYPDADLRTLIDIAGAIGEWIISGELPAPEPGTTY
jgi:hypothetical protein